MNEVLRNVISIRQEKLQGETKSLVHISTNEETGILNGFRRSFFLIFLKREKLARLWAIKESGRALSAQI